MASTTLYIKIRTITGKEISLDINPTSQSLQINERIEADSGIPLDQHWLISGGQKIDEDKTRTAKDYKIEDGATLNLVLTLRGGGADECPARMHIKIRKLDGDEITVETDSNCTIQQIKDFAQLQFESSLAKHRLTFASEMLEEDRTAASHDIKDGDTLGLGSHRETSGLKSHTKSQCRKPEDNPTYRTKTCKFFAEGRTVYQRRGLYVSSRELIRVISRRDVARYGLNCT